jgi:hypothetical protein
MEIKMRSSSMILLSALLAVFLVFVASTRNEAAATAPPEAVAATPVAVPEIPPIRAVSSPSCSTDGCPTACAPKELLVSAICIGVTGAKFSDAIQVADGVMTASCGSRSNSIVVLCARQ